MIKDYIFAVTDLTAFRASLLLSDSSLVHVDVESNTATLAITKTAMCINNTQAVFLTRSDSDLLTELESLPNLTLCGEAATQYIASADDVTWLNKPLYHSIYDISPVIYTDEEGVEQTYNKPVLHAAFASANSAATNITKITVRAFKQRLTIAERHALRNTSDSYAVDIYDDLLTSSYVDLELSDVAQGVGYILNLLSTVLNVQDENVMTVLDANTRLTELLVDGTVLEKYNGVL